jgi:hypothetical protein
MQSRGYKGSRESLHSGMTYSARRGSNASVYEGESRNLSIFSFAFFVLLLFRFHFPLV